MRFRFTALLQGAEEGFKCCCATQHRFPVLWYKEFCAGTGGESLFFTCRAVLEFENKRKTVSPNGQAGSKSLHPKAVLSLSEGSLFGTSTNDSLTKVRFSTQQILIPRAHPQQNPVLHRELRSAPESCSGLVNVHVSRVFVLVLHRNYYEHLWHARWI